MCRPKRVLEDTSIPGINTRLQRGEIQAPFCSAQAFLKLLSNDMAPSCPQGLVLSLIPEDRSQEKAVSILPYHQCSFTQHPPRDPRGWCAPPAPSSRCTVWPVPPTEVDVFHSWPLGVGDILAEGLQDLLLHLAKRVCVHGSDTQGVHPAALEGDVEVLWAEAALEVSGAPMDAQSSGAAVRQDEGCHLQFTASKSADLCSLATERCNLLMEPRGHREQCCALLSCCPANGPKP